MSKTNDLHPVRIVLRDWSKVHKANTVAEKTEHIPSLSDEWVENESRRILNKWANRVVHA